MNASASGPQLLVQINQIDHILSSTGPLDNSTFPKAPIIRIYGFSSTGEKACVNIHQVYPYFFVEYAGKMDPEEVNRYIARLSHSLNHAIALSLKRNPQSPNSQFIRAILLVKGVHFYGFHSSYSPFLKVLIVDPTVISRAVAIMQSGTVMGTRFCIYESHLSYTLQFLSDFALYGCGVIELGEVWQRGQTGEDLDLDSGAVYFKISPHFRQSRMQLEVDACAHQILNRHRLTSRNIHHKLEIPAPPLPSEPLVLSMRELWEDERRRRVAEGLPPTPVIPVDPSESSRGAGSDWVAEVRWWDEIRKRIEEERGDNETLETDTNEWERWVMTTFESVQALWEDQYKTWRPELPEGKMKEEGMHQSRESDVLTEMNPYGLASGSSGSQGPIEHVDIDVNENLLSSQSMSQLEEVDYRLEIDDIGQGDEEQALEDEEVTEHEDGLPPAEDYSDDSASRRHFHDEIDSRRSASPSHDTFPGSAARPLNAFRNAFVKLTRCVNPPVDSALIPLTLRERSGERGSDSSDLDASVVTNGSSLPVPTLLTTHMYHGENHDEPHINERVNIPFPVELEFAPRTPPPLHVSSMGDLEQRTFSDASDDSSHILPVLRDNDADLGEAPLIGNRADQTVVDQIHASQEKPPHECAEDSSHRGSNNGGKEASEGPRPASSRPRISLVFRSPMRSGLAAQTTRLSYWEYAVRAPSIAELFGAMDKYGIPFEIYHDPYYSRESDAPERPREYAGLLYHLRGGGLASLRDWDDEEPMKMSNHAPQPLESMHIKSWEFAGNPPNVMVIRRWLKDHPLQCGAQSRRVKQTSQIEGPSPVNSKNTPSRRTIPSLQGRRSLSVFSLEVFAPSREHRVPDSAADEVAAVCYAFQSEDDGRIEGISRFICTPGLIAINGPQFDPRRLRSRELDSVKSELDLLNKLVDVVLDLDPDILVGWEIRSGSWGYLSARANHYGMDIAEQIARAPGRHNRGRGAERWNVQTTSTFIVPGRHVLNLWRILRVEHAFTSYTLQSVAYHMLRRRIPWYSSTTLTDWFRSDVPEHTDRLLEHFFNRATLVLEILEKAQIITKTAEFARVFGVDFFSVISRGSQFKVESFMFRIAKPESFVLLSPSRQDVGTQNAAECMPLIMEPLSAFYNSPMVVLDFQSLYPSIMIAYNYCYSTCLGRVVDFKGRNKFGVAELRHPRGLLNVVKDHLNVAPNGIMYVKPEVRKGLLGRMLKELLETRVMVKQGMKRVKGDTILHRVLDARQLGLKYIANVTYGYTSATYSGRMPAVEIADSIVQSGRETLEKALRVIDSTAKWGAKVVYGDTDSLFIYLRGKTKQQAFRIGQDIADTITAMNPAPVKLKFEKVYLPCVLMAKKRYVGLKYEHPDDSEPTFDAKGIETVRRDGIPAQQKMVEQCLKIFFRTQDLSEVKNYCQRSWHKILEEKTSAQDFIFAKEVRMGTYSDKVPPPPGVAVAARRLMLDPNDEAQYGDRIPYVIALGLPGSRLVDRARDPHEFLREPHMHLDIAYYISRVLIPPLERIFNLVGADVQSWYDEMPKTVKADLESSGQFSPKKTHQNLPDNRLKIDKHFQGSQCVVCGSITTAGICETCRQIPQQATAGLLNFLRKDEKRLSNVQRICASCSRSPPGESIKCESLDCPWFFERSKVEGKSNFHAFLQDLVQEIDSNEVHRVGLPDSAGHIEGQLDYIH